MPIQPIGGEQLGQGPQPRAGAQAPQRQVDLGALLARGPSIAQPVGQDRSSMGRGIGRGLEQFGEAIQRQTERKQEQKMALQRMAQQNAYDKELQQRKWKQQAHVEQLAQERNRRAELRAATLQVAEHLRLLIGTGALNPDTPQGQALLAQVRGMAQELASEELRAVAAYERQALAPWVDEINRQAGSDAPALTGESLKPAGKAKAAPERTVLPDGRIVADPELLDDGITILTVVDTLLQTGDLMMRTGADAREFERTKAVLLNMMEQTTSQVAALDQAMGTGNPEAIATFVDALYKNLELPVNADEVIGRTLSEVNPPAAVIAQEVNKLAKSGKFTDEATAVLPNPSLVAFHNWCGAVLADMQVRVQHERQRQVDEGGRGIVELAGKKLNRVREVMTALQHYHGWTGLMDVQGRYRATEQILQGLGPEHQAWIQEQRVKTGERPDIRSQLADLAQRVMTMPGMEEVRALLAGEVESPSEVLDYRMPVFQSFIRNYQGEQPLTEVPIGPIAQPVSEPSPAQERVERTNYTDWRDRGTRYREDESEFQASEEEENR